jgi:hypothetical protein
MVGGRARRVPTQIEVPIAGYSEFATTADFNNDDHADLAIGLWDPVASNYAVAILLGDGHGAVSTPVHHEVGDGASSNRRRQTSTVT